MIINSNYFKNEIYIPGASSSITGHVVDVDSELMDLIREYCESCLNDCLGTLFFELEENIDETKDKYLVDGADEKWDWLLNGIDKYEDYNGKTKRFKGIRSKSVKNSDIYDTSFLAYYVYYFYQSDNFIKTMGTGDSKPKPKNAELVSPTFKVVKAWRKFYKLVVGEEITPSIISRNFGVGVDYYKPNTSVSLYQFIRDMNKLDANTYPNFEPKKWSNMNRFGI